MKFGDDQFEFLPAAECRPFLRHVLLKAHKSFAKFNINGMERMIRHSPNSHSPAKPLPWPFSKFQMHDVEICHFKPDNTIQRKRFTKEQIDIAIEEFLDGAQPGEEIHISSEFR